MKNILVIGSSGSGKTTYVAKIAEELYKNGEKLFLLDNKGSLEKKLMDFSVKTEEEPSGETILLVDDAICFDFSEIPYKKVILCTSDRAKYEDLLLYFEFTEEFHLFSFQPENGFKASDIFGDVSLKSFSLNKFQSFIIEKNEQ